MRASILALLLLAASAYADVGAWTPVDVRVPVYTREGNKRPNILWQVQTEWWWLSAAHGVNSIELRTGPMLDLAPWILLAIRAADVVDHSVTGFVQDIRFELEPTFKWRIWNFTFNYRNRFEVRWREDLGTRFRDRNQLRVAYEPPGARWIPYIADELFVDFYKGWVNENRAMAALGYRFGKESRVEVGYMLRAREPSGSWILDHYPYVSLLIVP